MTYSEGKSYKGPDTASRSSKRSKVKSVKSKSAKSKSSAKRSGSGYYGRLSVSGLAT